MAAIQKNADHIVYSIVKKLAPREICHGLMPFCANNPKIEIDTRIEQVATQLMNKYSDTPLCFMCELIANTLDAVLKNDMSREVIESCVRGVCYLLPGEFSAECQAFIDQYADIIINSLVKLPPKKLCASLFFCVNDMTMDTNQRDDLECKICNMAVDALSTVLQKNGPKENKTTCHLLPAKYYDQCQDLMNIYGISLTTLIKRSEKRSDICVQVGKCFRDRDSSMFFEINGGEFQTILIF